VCGVSAMEIMYFNGNSNESKAFLNNEGNVHSVTIIACPLPLVIYLKTVTLMGKFF
jgi:hypothetical protein